jgi:hypothetical protein
MVQDLVRSELLEEPLPGRYQSSFLNIRKEELQQILGGPSLDNEALEILNRRLPELETVFAKTDLCRRQGFCWRDMAWIALPCWIMSRGLARQLDQLPEWGRHHVWHYPIRPVDFWHALGLADLSISEVMVTDCSSHECDYGGMARASIVTYCLGREQRRMIDTRDQARFVGGLLQGPATEGSLLAGSSSRDEDRQKLARYVEEGYIRRLNDSRFELAVPAVSREDDDLLVPVVDSICSELASGMLERSLNAFVARVEEQGFGHLRAQPHYLGFVGFLMIASSVIHRFMEESHLTEPDVETPNLGCWAWQGGKLMTSWRKGR